MSVLMFANEILKSIKWRLQLWYGLILVVVLAGFGLPPINWNADGKCAGLTTNCSAALAIIADALRRPPPHGPDRQTAF